MTCDLPSFNPEAKCPKCLNEAVRTHYHDESFQPKWWVCNLSGFSHLHRTCERCRYEWAEAPADVSPPVGEPVHSSDPQERIGQALVKGAFLSPQDLDKSLEESRNTGKKLVDVLLSRQLVSPETLVTIMSFALNAPVVDMRQIKVQPEAVALIPESIAREYGVMPISVEGDVLRVAMENPQDLQLVYTLNAVSGKRVKPVLPLRGGIKDVIDLNYKRWGRKKKDEK